MITIISGTNRANSNTIIIANYYARVLQKLGAEVSVLDLRKLPADFIFSALYGLSGKNEEFNEFQNDVRKAQKLVFIVPEYNGSFPGVLKAFIDGFEYPNFLKGKTCGLVGLSSGFQGASLALSHLTDVMHYLDVQVLPIKPRLAFVDNKLSEAGAGIEDKIFVQLIQQQAEELLK